MKWIILASLVSTTLLSPKLNAEQNQTSPDALTLPAEVVRLKRELDALREDHVQTLKLLQEVATVANRAHERLNGVKLYVADTSISNEFRCGQEETIGGTWVMSGSRDGTSCFVPNRNHYKRLEVSVPQ
jgi:outer membrane murein-binding lipoprotein Lpp